MIKIEVLIYLPIILGFLTLLAKPWSKWVALPSALLALVLAGIVFFDKQASTLSSGIFLAAAFFTFSTILYSIKFAEGKEYQNKLLGYFIISLGATAGIVFAVDYAVMVAFWGILGTYLYLCIGLGGSNAAAAAKKTLIIVGGTDALMLVGVGIIYCITNSLTIGYVPIPLNGLLPILAFLFIAVGALTKAGAIPLHSWIPDSAEVAPLPVMAFLPAAIDKLVGIYLLYRISINIFLVVPNSAVSLCLLTIGSITIIVAVMAALIQHNLKKLFSFHAVSQVGYMVIGIGSGIPIAIAGGLFHMLNHAIYKSLLFLTAGAVEKETGTTELDQLGGLGKIMPITFTCALIASLSISGIPPFNGFVSKWMIYQGIVELAKFGPLWIIWLTAAMFGSALTLASFVKILHAVFLGQQANTAAKAHEVHWTMWLPMATLAFICVVFGVFAFPLPLTHFILPVVGTVAFIGSFSPVIALALLIVGLLIGWIIYKAGNSKQISTKPIYIGGEILSSDQTKVSGTTFYNTIKDWGFLPKIYKAAEQQLFDLYAILGKVSNGIAGMLGYLHDGHLQTYLAWMLLGILLLGLTFYFEYFGPFLGI
ncbi:MAG: proton-conducting transporter membrane subunit [Candidatus Margulisiibacteriota bacterium]